MRGSYSGMEPVALEIVMVFQVLLYSLAPEVLLAQSEPIVESLEAIGGEGGAEGGGVGGGGQPVGGGGGAEGVGGLQPCVQEVETVEGVVVAVLDRLGSLGLSSADHLIAKSVGLRNDPCLRLGTRR